MKNRTLIYLSVFALMLATNLNAQNTGTGMDWDDNPPASPILVDENFQGFDFFHSDETPDEGNSNNNLDEDGETIIWGYTDIDKVEVPIINGGGGTVSYSFSQCAFSPDWMTAWAYKDLNESGSGENTANVSNGFVEVSREYPSAVPTLPGYFEVDLTNITFVDMIQWTHSSCGGRRRGVLVEISLDNGASWDTLRYQPGDQWSLSFTRDPFTGEDTPNTYSCEPSAYGMTWVDELYMENVMLRFVVANGQVPRIHDLKVYGEYSATPVNDVKENLVNIYAINKQVHLSKRANVEIYNMNGMLVASDQNTNLLSLDQYARGVYFVKATIDGKVQTEKLSIQ